MVDNQRVNFLGNNKMHFYPYVDTMLLLCVYIE